MPRGKKRSLHPEIYGPKQPAETDYYSSLPIVRAFTIIPVDSIGMTLYKVVLLSIQGDKVIDTTDVTSPDMKKNALHRLHVSAYQLYFEERLPRTIDETNAAV